MKRLSDVLLVVCLVAPTVDAAVRITVTPGTATLRIGAPMQFQATLAGALPGMIVRWYVNDSVGGSPVTGTISTTGLYSTPAAIPATGNRVTVKASVFASATATTAAASDTTAVTLQNPTPVITSAGPPYLKPGAFDIAVNGSGFLPTSTAVLSGLTGITVSYVSPSQIRITGTVTDAFLGVSLPLRVSNPSPGASSSSIVLMNVQSYDGPAKVARMEAWRFLRQASWGPSPKDVDRIQAIGKSAWLEEQFAAPVSDYPNTLMDKPLEYTQEYFYRLALTQPDQLRLRMAFALHKILVVSGVEVDCAEAFIPYMRILHRNAFGNFYNVMKEITLNPAMGEYLDMVNNVKASSPTGEQPNENYARELMQLFTIGLYKLNTDGTQQTGSDGQPIPTYGQTEVMGLTRALTGWTYSDRRAGKPTRLQSEYYLDPLEAVDNLHDTGVKQLPEGVQILAGRTPEQDLDEALTAIFRHPNLGPFIARQLIQQFVTSTPSPSYVARVSRTLTGGVWGIGARGDLKSTLRAILLDVEATSLPASGGKLMEPALYVTSMLRSMRANVTDHPFMADLAAEMGQRLFYPPSVFSYFSPGFRTTSGLNAPEFQILTTATSMVRTNFAARLLSNDFGSAVKIDYNPWKLLAKQPDLLVDQAANVLLGGRISPAMKQAILAAVEKAPNDTEKMQTVLYLILSSPQYQIDY